MATPTTTFEEIRNQWLTVIRAITPTKHSSTKFRPFESHMVFEDWVIENAQACLRVFEVLDDTDRADPSETVSNHDVEYTVSEARIVVAYPYLNALYGSENRRDLQDFMRADANQIRKAIGINGAANYTSGQCLAKADYSFDFDSEVAAFLNFDITAEFYFDISSV